MCPTLCIRLSNPTKQRQAKGNRQTAQALRWRCDRFLAHRSRLLGSFVALANWVGRRQFSQLASRPASQQTGRQAGIHSASRRQIIIITNFKCNCSNTCISTKPTCSAKIDQVNETCTISYGPKLQFGCYRPSPTWPTASPSGCTCLDQSWRHQSDQIQTTQSNIGKLALCALAHNEDDNLSGCAIAAEGPDGTTMDLLAIPPTRVLVTN